MSSYSGSVKFPEWRWQRRRADLRHFEIFRHGPIIIYTRLPAGVTYYLICTFLASSEYLIAFLMPFLPLFTGIRHLPHALTVPPTKACLLCATPVGMDLYIQVHARRLLPSAVPWISEDRLFFKALDTNQYSLIKRRCFCTSYMYMLFFTASLLFKCCFVT